MADISTDQLNAISQLLATQQQSDNANQKLAEEISSLGSLVDQERQKSSNDAEIASAISKYKRILGDIDKTSGILNRNEAPMGFFESLVRGAESGPNPLSNSQRLDYLNQLKSLQEQKDIAAQNLKAYLPKEPEKARPASELQVPEPAKAAPATPQPTQPSQQPAQEQPQQRSSQFDAFERINAERSQFLNFAFQELTKLPPRMQKQGAEMIKTMADQRYKLPPNVAVPLINAATGQVIPELAFVNGKVEKLESGKDTDKEEERMRELGVSGVGIARTVQEARDIRAAQVSKKNADSMIDQLIEIANKPGAAFNPQDRAKADQISTLLEGAMRVQILGPGAVTEPDRQVLKSTIANPAQIFKLKGNVLNALNNLKRVNQQNLENMYESGIYKRFEQPQGQQQQQQGGKGGQVEFTRGVGGKLIIPK
jgi:hypothetical protein